MSMLRVLSCVAVPLVCHGHSRPVVDLFHSPVTPDGYFLISASKDSTPMLRNGETETGSEPLRGIKLGDKFIAGGEVMRIRLSDFNTGEEIGLPGVLLIPSFCSNTRLFRVLSTISSEFYSFG
ncbi:putative WD40-repeat-containing domain superfamily [Helianthus debilis subsp. tardiflorus]